MCHGLHLHLCALHASGVYLAVSAQLDAELGEESYASSQK